MKWSVITKLIIILSMIAITQGCGVSQRPLSAPDPALALRLNSQATTVYPEDAEKARKILQKALRADPFCGPALNNLGALYLEENRLDKAFESLESARRIMPMDPRPHVNLGLLFANVNQYENAIAEYDEALRLNPDYMPAIMQKAWLQIHEDRADDTTLHALEKIAIRAHEEEWRDFGRKYSMRLRSRSELGLDRPSNIFDENTGNEDNVITSPVQIDDGDNNNN